MILQLKYKGSIYLFPKSAARDGSVVWYNEPMKRVAVLGCPGSGKTTFARKLAAKTGLPLIHLDFYYHQTEHDYLHNETAWTAKAKQLISQDSWIMDGNYRSTIDLRLKRADTIIFFDFPRRKSLHGVIKRRIQYRNKRREEMPSDWQEKANLKFLLFVWRFRKNNRVKTLKAIEASSGKNIIMFTNRKQVNKYLSAVK